MTEEEETGWNKSEESQPVTIFFFLFIFYLFFSLETAETLEHIAYDVEEVYFAIATAASTR